MAAISFSRRCSVTRLISQIIKLQPVTIHLSTALIFFLHGSHFHHSSNVISQWVTGTAVQTPSVMYCGATIRKLESPLCGKHLHSNHWVWNWFYLSGIGTISCGFPLPVKCSFYNLGAEGMLIAFDEGAYCNDVFLWTLPEKVALFFTWSSWARWVPWHFPIRVHTQAITALQTCRFLKIMKPGRLGVPQTSGGTGEDKEIETQKDGRLYFDKVVKSFQFPPQFISNKFQVD